MSRYAIQLMMLGIVFFLLALQPEVLAAAWVNLAQVSRVKLQNDWVARKAFEYALTLAPDDSHILWQAAASLVENNEAGAAAEILYSLLEQDSKLHSQDPNLVIPTFIEAGLVEQITPYYESLEKPPRLNSQMASTLALYYLKEYSHIPLEYRNELISQAFRHTITEYELLKLLVNKAEWSASTVRNMCDTLNWLSLEEDKDCNRFGVNPTDSLHIRSQVAELLEVLPEDIDFGQELVVNGGFEQLVNWTYWYGIPKGWSPSFMVQEDPFNRAIFVVGTDCLRPFSGKKSMRIDGLLIERLPEREKARAGFWHKPITVTVECPYVISFVYKTSIGDDTKAYVWLSYDPMIIFAHDRSFPPTDGVWRRVIIIAWNRREKDAVIKPLLRSFHEGSVWFDDFSIREVIVDSPVPPQDALIDVVDATR